MGRHEEHTPGLGSFDKNGKFIKGGIRKVTTQTGSGAQVRYPAAKVVVKKKPKAKQSDNTPTEPFDRKQLRGLLRGGKSIKEERIEIDRKLKRDKRR